MVVKSLQDDKEVAIRIEPLEISKKEVVVGKSVEGTLMAVDTIELDSPLSHNDTSITSVSVKAGDIIPRPKPEVSL